MATMTITIIATEVVAARFCPFTKRVRVGQLIVHLIQVVFTILAIVALPSHAGVSQRSSSAREARSLNAARHCYNHPDCSVHYREHGSRVRDPTTTTHLL